MNTLRIAMIGLDTSHVEAFARLLHDPNQPDHVPGGKIVSAFPGGSDDFTLSRDRVEGFTAILRDQYGVSIKDSPEAAAECADAILLESVDGRVHREQFERIAGFGKPVFVDKPFALSSEDAKAMVSAAEGAGVPLMSCSALRFAAGVQEALQDQRLGNIIGADVFGPMGLEPTQPGFFWYGIHSAEMLVAALGPSCGKLHVASNSDHDLLLGEWENGQFGSLRGNRKGNDTFGAVFHRERGSTYVDLTAHAKPYYASLLEAVLPFFHSGESPVPLNETLAIIDLLERANALRAETRE